MTWRVAGTSARPDPSAIFREFGYEFVKLKADEGDRAAQYSQAGAYTRPLFSST